MHFNARPVHGRPVSRSGLLLWLARKAVVSSPADTMMRLSVMLVATVILLVGCALGPTASARSQRAADAEFPLRAPRAASAGLLIGYERDYFDGAGIQLLSMTRVGDTAPSTLDHTPVPLAGQLVVSREVRTLLARSPELRQRYPGRIVATVPPGRLMGPRDLVIWRGVDRAAAPPNAGWLDQRAGAHGTLDVRVPMELQYAYPVLLLGFLLPLVALIALLATVGGARREQRLASLRLLGLTDRDAKLSVALEEAWISGAALCLGVAVFVAFGEAVAQVLPGDGVWAEDVHVGWRLAAVMLVGLPLVALGVSMMALRPLKTSPLGSERHTVVRRVRRWRIIPIAIGCIGLVVSRLPQVQGSTHGGDALLISAGLLSIGIPLSLPLLAPNIARRMRNASVSGLLASRRLEADPQHATRVAVGLTLLVLMSGIVLMFLPLIAESHATSYDDAGRLLGRQTLFAEASAYARAPMDGVSEETAWKAALESTSVRDGLRLVELDLRSSRAGDERGARLALFAVDCDEAQVVLALTPSECRRGLAAPGYRSQGAQWFHVRNQRAASFRLPSHPVASPVVDLMSAAGNTEVGLIIPIDVIPGQVSLATRDAYYLARAENHHLEEARTALETSLGRPVLTFDERHAISAHATRQYQIVTLIAAGLIVLIAALATLVSAYDQVRRTERERNLLRVAGVSKGLLSRSLGIQVLLPVALGVVPAVAATLNLAAGFSTLVRQQGSVVSPPTTQVLLVATVALGPPLLATALVL
jgi:hypothetical protein